MAPAGDAASCPAAVGTGTGASTHCRQGGEKTAAKGTEETQTAQGEQGRRGKAGTGAGRRRGRQRRRGWRRKCCLVAPCLASGCCPSPSHQRAATERVAGPFRLGRVARRATAATNACAVGERRCDAMARAAPQARGGRLAQLLTSAAAASAGRRRGQ